MVLVRRSALPRRSVGHWVGRADSMYEKLQNRHWGPATGPARGGPAHATGPASSGTALASGPASSGPALATGPACSGQPGSTPHVIETVWSLLAKEFPTIVCKLECYGQSLFFTATVGEHLRRHGK